MSTKIRKRIAKVNNWLILNSGCTPYIVGFGMKQWTTGVAKRYPKYPLISFCGIRYTKSGSEAQFIADRDEYRNSAKKLFDHLDVLQKTYQDFCKDEKRFVKFVRDIQTKGEDYLHRHFSQFIVRYDAEYTSSMASDGTLVYSDELISEMMKKYPRHKREINRLTQMYGRSFFTEYQMSLLNVALQSKKRQAYFRNILSDMSLRKEIDRVKKNFFWIKCNYKNVDPITTHDVLEELHELARLPSREITHRLKDLQESVQKQRKAVRKIRTMKIFRANDFQKLFWLGKLAWMFDRRKKYNLLANYYIGRHLKWLSKKYGIKEEQAFFLLPWEMDKIASGKKRIEDFPIRERQKESTHFYDTNGHELFLLGDESRQIWETVSPKVTKSQKEIKGFVAQKGIVRGTARVVMDAHNVDSFHRGDILVTGMTRPDFISLMRKAAAFVTDEGGITCHAAIVAREMQKPCIIGTKIATQILKDGDLVEIDANEGIVRILKASFNKPKEKIVDMSGWNILPEAGRAGWLYVVNTIGNYFAMPHPKWGVITGGVVQNKNNKFQLFFTINDNSKFEFILQRFFDNDQLLEELEVFITDTKNAAIKKLHKKQLSSLSNDQLAKITDSYFSRYTDMHRAALILRLLDRGCLLKLREIFSKEKNTDEFIANIAVATRLTFSLQEEIKLLELARKIQKSKKRTPESKSELKTIMDSYQWSTLGYFDEKAKTMKDYESKLAHSLAGDPRKTLRLLRERIAGDIEGRDAIVKTIKSKRDRKIVSIAGESTYLKDYFKSSVNEVQFHGEALFEEIARRTGFPVTTLKNLLQSEISGLLRGETIDLALIKKRIKHSIFVGKYDGQLHLMAGKNADVFEKKYLSHNKEGAREFKGRSACMGKVTGLAKVVLNNDDFKKMNQGDVLIVMNTSPDFVPVLGKSAAIVAEEGGLTAHVSVISRELNIPCIVGIPGITKVLKDEDLVEVDANKGVVKILKRV